MTMTMLIALAAAAAPVPPVPPAPPRANDERFAAARGKAFDRLDADHDGKISRDEFAAPRGGRTMIFTSEDGHGATLLPPPSAPGAPRVIMMRRGLEGVDERSVTRKEAQDAALARFDAADANHDGTLTPEERRGAMQAWSRQMGEWGHRLGEWRGRMGDMPPPPAPPAPPLG